MEPVNTERHSEPANPDSGFRRVLSFLLLALILYGTTIQAVHKHGTIIGAGDPSSTVFLADSKSNEKSSGVLVGCGDCLICQLHQSFSATLVADARFDSPAPQIVLFSRNDDQNFPSFVSTTKTGRAPPFTS
jgi:hypothetical protein